MSVIRHGFLNCFYEIISLKFLFFLSLSTILLLLTSFLCLLILSCLLPPCVYHCHRVQKGILSSVKTETLQVIILELFILINIIITIFYFIFLFLWMENSLRKYSIMKTENWKSIMKIEWDVDGLVMVKEMSKQQMLVLSLRYPTAVGLLEIFLSN